MHVAHFELIIKKTKLSEDKKVQLEDQIIVIIVH